MSSGQMPKGLIVIKDYYFPTHEQAQKFRVDQEKKGYSAEVIPRLRVGTVIYCVKVTDTKATENGNSKQQDDVGGEQESIE